jgi:DNA-binding CsgD family transcriptional regulator
VRIGLVSATASDLARRLLELFSDRNRGRINETWERAKMPDAAAGFVSFSGAPAFTSGPDGTLTGWTQAAERLLQTRSSEVLGRSCHEVIAGRDQFGNLYCGRNCPIRRMARRGISISSFRLDVADAAGAFLALNISIVVVDGGPDRGPSLVHLLEPLFGETDERLEIENHPSPQTQSNRRIERLTAREVEVLRMIGTGATTVDCAAALGISTVTVRNHVQSCFRKLNAHNRIEAVRLAERLGLFDGLQLV